MSYVVGVWEQPVGLPLPVRYEDAERLLAELRKSKPGRNAKFAHLAQQLMRRYPWDESSMDESSCAWTDVELTGDTEEAVYNIGITAELLDDALPAVVAEANALGLHVLDYQSGRVHLAGPQSGQPSDTGGAAELHQLGHSYLLGKGVKRNRAAAYALFSLAGQDASEDLASLAKTMQAKHIEFAKKLALQISKPGQLNKILAAFEQSNEKSYQAAYEAGRVEDYASALRHLRPLAENGHPDAQFMLGLMYTDGRGVPADAKQAFQYFLHSAQGGNAQAQHNLAHAYENGTGAGKDAGKALHWYQQAAKQGQSKSAAALKRLSGQSEPILPAGVLHQTKTHKIEQKASGDLVITGSISANRLVEHAMGDSEKMLQLRRRAEQGDAAAQFELGEMYRMNVLPRDMRQAADWLGKAAEQGHANAMHSLGILYQEGAGVPQDYIAALALWALARSKGFKADAVDIDEHEKKATLALLEKMCRPGKLQAALQQHLERHEHEAEEFEQAAKETEQLRRGRKLLAVAFLLHVVTVLVDRSPGAANVQGVFWILAAIAGMLGMLKILGPMRYSPSFERLLKLLILGPIIGLLTSFVVGLHVTWRLRALENED